jgi:hypothetical protein
MRMLLLFLIIGSGTIYAQSQENLPLTPDEGRQVLGQLNELQSARKDIKVLEDAAARDKEQDARAKELSDQAIQNERDKTDIEKERTALAQEKATMWEQLYRSVTKKPGAGCKFLRVITIGIHRCN